MVKKKKPKDTFQEFRNNEKSAYKTFKISLKTILVHGLKDGDEYQSLNYSGLIAVMVKEIQCLKKDIEILKSGM